MTHHPATTDDAFPISSPFQGVDDREIHNEIATADLFYDSAHTAPAKNFSKPLPSSKSDCTDSPPDKIARLMDEAPPGELGGAEECETCLSCKKAKRAAESWTELDEFTCACENVRGGSGGRVELGMLFTALLTAVRLRTFLLTCLFW